MKVKNLQISAWLFSRVYFWSLKIKLTGTRPSPAHLPGQRPVSFLELVPGVIQPVSSAGLNRRAGGRVGGVFERSLFMRPCLFSRSCQDAQEELQEFQEGSRELEAELEAQLCQAEHRLRDLQSENERLKNEIGNLKVIRPGRRGGVFLVLACGLRHQSHQLLLPDHLIPVGP